MTESSLQPGIDVIRPISEVPRFMIYAMKGLMIV